jgi:uncharacterized protein
MSTVYFTSMETKHGTSLEAKFKKLLSKAELPGLIGKDELVALKVHVGEMENFGFVSHNYARIVVDEVKKHGGNPFLTDTSTLYSGGRHTAVSHLRTAILHGFSYVSTNAPFIIADGLRGMEYRELPSKGSHFKKLKLASSIIDADKAIFLSHFKGHCEAGFGGTIKNLGMGCAAIPGKKDQHSSSKPSVTIEACTGCGHCERVCPESAIVLIKKKAVIDYNKCIGCGQCMAACNYDAMKVDWNTHAAGFTDRVCEYAAGTAERFKSKSLYVNFAFDITPDCDCWGYNEPPIVNDVGILISDNPVAVDRATLDLVNKSEPNVRSQYYDTIKKVDDIFGAMRGGASERWFDTMAALGFDSTYQLVTI